jgi:tubulin--tyrosine ligase
LIATKTGLFLTLKQYYSSKGMKLFEAVPETYLINVECRTPEEYKRKDLQLEEFSKVCRDHIWILKPGENTNRGHGIQIFNELRKVITSINNEYLGSYKTVIL